MSQAQAEEIYLRSKLSHFANPGRPLLRLLDVSPNVEPSGER